MAKEFKMPGNVVECPHCRTLVQYDISDLKGDYKFTEYGTVHWTYIDCPKCQCQIQFNIQRYDK